MPPPPTMPLLPPGFRFHPTDAELITHYLANQSSSNPIPAPIIAEVNIYRSNPWDLPPKALFGARDGEWFFFSPRDRKYPNGARPNRAAGDGYWKATGTDKPIASSDSASGSSSAIVGVKKALVFYQGKPPKGVKTDWIMHEYRLASSAAGKRRSSAGSSSMRLDDWVLCRIHKKSSSGSTNLHNFSSSSEHEQEESSTVEESSMNNNNSNNTMSSPKSEAFDSGNDEQLQELRPMAIAKSCSITDLLNTVDYASLSHLLLDGAGGVGSSSTAAATTAAYYDQLPAPGTEESPLIYAPPNPWQTINCNDNNGSLSYLKDVDDAIALPQLAEQEYDYSNGDQYINGVKRKRSSGGYCNQLQQVSDDHLLAGNSSSSGLQYSGMLIHPFLMNNQQLQM